MLRCTITHLIRAIIIILACVSFAKGEGNAFADDDRECKRHNQEGICLKSTEHSTCGCLFHEKPLTTISEWREDENIRVFRQVCEPLNLPFHEDTCKVYPVNPNENIEYEFVCPNDGFLQTWGAFAPKEGSYSIRLWFRCCEAACPKWNCQWSPASEFRQKFVVPMKGVFSTGTRGIYDHEQQDSSWSMKICMCDTTAQSRDEL